MTASPEAPHVGLVVEGAGDVAAVPLLIRRWLHADGEYRDLLGKPVCCNGREKALMLNGIEGKVATATARPGCRAVVIVLDGEGDPVCTLGPTLLSRAREITGLPVTVSLADTKYEEWLRASAETLELPGLAYGASGDPAHAIRQALLPAKYVKPTWQPRLTDRMDFELARSRDSSLRRMLDQVRDLIRTELSQT